MKIDRMGTWVSIGIALWGIPTGFFIALVCAFLTFDPSIAMRGFQGRFFVRYLIVFVPIFAFLGILIVIMLYYFVKRYIKTPKILLHK